MKPKHIAIRIQQCIALASASGCERRKFGALLVDPMSNVVLMDGYNGGPRGADGALCGGDVCLRTAGGVKSGTRMEVGCHHAEQNVICNAAKHGVRTDGAWIIVTGEPCLMCAKMLHHAGVSKVVCVRGGYAGGDDGPEYLRLHGVKVEYVDGPGDPRVA